MMKVILYNKIQIQIHVIFNLEHQKHILKIKNKICLWEEDTLRFTCCFYNLCFTSKFCVLANEMLGEN